MCETNRPGEHCRVDSRGRKTCGPTDYQREAMMESARLLSAKMRGDRGAGARLRAHRAKMLGDPGAGERLGDTRAEDLLLELRAAADAVADAENVGAMLSLAHKARRRPEGVGWNAPGGMRGVRLFRRPERVRPKGVDPVTGRVREARPDETLRIITKIDGVPVEEYGWRAVKRRQTLLEQAEALKAAGLDGELVRRAFGQPSPAERAAAEAADRAEKARADLATRSRSVHGSTIPDRIPATFSYVEEGARTRKSKSDPGPVRVPPYVVG